MIRGILESLVPLVRAGSPFGDDLYVGVHGVDGDLIVGHRKWMLGAAGELDLAVLPSDLVDFSKHLSVIVENGNLVVRYFSTNTGQGKNELSGYVYLDVGSVPLADPGCFEAVVGLVFDHFLWNLVCMGS